LARFSLTVLPGEPEVPETVEISYSNADPSKTLEVLVNDVVRATAPVDPSGSLDISIPVSPGQMRNALVDIGGCSAEFSEAGDILCSVRTGLGDKLQLRYQI
jgi:hypothetical protein